jgi:acetyl-CoA C-acetyltransferase
MAQRCAVIGVGQTQHDSKRIDVSQFGLVREAAIRALEDADLTWKDVDAVVIGKAPDLFEGVMMPELFLAEALGGAGKPMLRVHTAGSVGGSTAIVAASLVEAGVHDRVLTVSYEKQSESNAMWALSIRVPFQQAVVAGAGGFFAPLIRSYMRRSDAPEDTGIRVALKDRQNALKNPYAHLKFPGITFEQVADSPMLWDPIRYLETCPSSDGACAMLLASESVAKRAQRPPAWVHATAKAGISDPRREIDCAEIYVPFSWFEPMWMENLGFAPEGQGWRMTYDGVTALDGELPVNMSGGVLSSNPIGASGMLRFAEAANQVRGLAGEHQVAGASRALGHAYGGGSQYFSMWIVGAEPR